MPLTIEQVRHIATLARLELSETELARYAGQLSAILDYFEQLQAVETGQITPADSGEAPGARLRADDPRLGLALDELLRNAPDSAQNQFRVPPVFE